MPQQEKFSIEASLKKLAATATSLKDQYGFRYQSELRKFLQTASKRNDEITLDVKQRALAEWDRVKKTRKYAALSRRTIKVLCTLSETTTDPAFLGFLSAYPNFTSRMIRSLMGSYHINWKTHNTHNKLEQILKASIALFQGNNHTIDLWRTNLKGLIGDSGPNKLAQEMTTELHKLEWVSDKYQLVFNGTAYGGAVLIAAGDTVCLQILVASEGKFPKAQWQYLMNYVLISPLVKREQRQHLLATIIKTVERKRKETSSGAKSWQIAQESLKDYILGHADFGDPRIHAAKWHTFDATAKKIVVSWLSEEDLTFFFELIIQVDPHHRKPFWLNYIPSIRNSRVIVGPSDLEKHDGELQKLQERGRSFAKGVGLETSAFILDFGQYVIVEFSQVGNACYIYRAETFKKMFGDVLIDEFDLRDLKDRRIADHHQVHHQNWPQLLQAELKKRHIRGEGDHSGWRLW